VTSFGAQAHCSPVPDNDDYRQLANLRDVAGLRLAGGGLVPAGVLYRSDAPYPGDAVPGTVPHWPPATVIDLRSTGEAAARYRWPAGVTVHHVPLMRQAAVVGTDDSATRPGRPLPASLAVVYRRMLDMIPHRLAALPGMAADSGGPILVHCAAGKDRTGVAVAVLLLVGGAEPADVIADYTASAPNMAALLERLNALGRSLPADLDATSELLGAPAKAINVVVDRLTGWSGGPQAWAQAHGASASSLRRWQERLAAGPARP
jgi:rhodanese-related sulfurtransferase